MKTWLLLELIGSALAALFAANAVTEANVSNEVRMAYQIGYGIPGVMKNRYQEPVLRDGQPA